MKVAIVTVYNSINFGSYWQAFALKHIIESLGHEVYFVERDKKETSAAITLLIKRCIKRFVKFDFRGILFLIKRKIAFSKVEKNFKTIPQDSEFYKNIDCFVLGSDTIWNLDSNYFRKYYSIFWGKEFWGRKIITYAASVGNTKYDSIYKYEYTNPCLEHMENISVRDTHTEEIITKLCNKKIVKVCDPVMLLQSSDYYKWLSIKRDNRKYIFTYLFSPLSAKRQEELMRFAKENNLCIINGFDTCKYGEKDMIISPTDFLEYMINAEYVITDTFHGNVFSVVFNKQFVNIDCGKNKVSDFLSSLNIFERQVNENDLLIEKLLKPIDYCTLNALVDNLRQSSIDYIVHAVNESREK